MTVLRGKVEKTIAAENTFSEAIMLHGHFNFSVTGINGDTVWIQRSYDAGTNWKDVKSYVADQEDTGFEPELGTHYRFGVKTGGYSAGTIVGRISF